jgi:uncharacterized membrane protein YiaA
MCNALYQIFLSLLRFGLLATVQTGLESLEGVSIFLQRTQLLFIFSLGMLVFAITLYPEVVHPYLMELAAGLFSQIIVQYVFIQVYYIGGCLR